jgi:DNA-binding beta-propeller fold protein YncE
VADYNDGILRRLDPRTGRLLATIKGVGLHVEAIVATPRAIWVASVGPWTKNSHGEITPVGDGLVTRIDPRSDRIVARIRVGRGPGTLTVGAGSIWVANFRGLRPDFSVSRIDPRSNRVAATIRLHRLLAGITAADGYVWVMNPGRLLRGGLDMSGGTLIRIDPRSDRVIARRLPGSSRPAAIAFARGKLWIGSPGNGYVLRVNPKTMTQTRIPIPFA